MLVTGNQITEQTLLSNADANNLRGASYYLRIHSIIPAGEETKSYDPSKPRTIHTLEPGGMAWVISEEQFHIDKTTVTALVTLRSSFTKKGLLALDVGLVDANFFGPIGSLVINFSKKPIRLDAKEEFFRVLFFEHAKAEGKQIPEVIKYTHETYAKKILADMVGGFSSTFLQTAEMEERIVKSLENGLVEKLEPDILSRLAYGFFKKHGAKLLLILFAALLFGWGLGATFGIGNYFHTEEQIKDIIKSYRLEQREENP